MKMWGRSTWGNNTCIKSEARDSKVEDPWILSKDVILAVQYKVYLVKQVISLVDIVQYS